MKTYSRSALFTLFAAPFAALAAVSERPAIAAATTPSQPYRVNAAGSTLRTSIPRVGKPKVFPKLQLPAPARFVPVRVVTGNQGGDLQAQITALQNQVSALQSSLNGLGTFSANTFAFAVSVDQFARTISNSLNLHCHESETSDGSWLLTSLARF